MDLDWMAAHSYINCHAIGLDSILFREKNPATGQGELRAFITQKHHTMWRNWLPNIFSVAVHPHHCDITLIPRYGMVWNIRPGRGRNHQLKNSVFRMYRYQSAIKEKEGLIIPTDTRACPTMDYELMQLPIFMQAHELHTVYVPEKFEAAWFVLEGREDPDYVPVMWSNDEDLEHFNFSELYQPMSVDYLVKALLRLGIDYHQHVYEGPHAGVA